jgi:hypothetical protein
VDDLSTALNAGQSVDQLATAHQTTTAEVKAAMLAAGQAAVARALQQATITQQQADDYDQTLVPAIAEKVTHANTQSDLSLSGTPAPSSAADQAAIAEKLARGAASASGTPLADNPADKAAIADKTAVDMSDPQQQVVSAMFDAAARQLGLSVDQLKSELGSSQLASVAQQHGLTQQQVSAALLAAGRSALASQVQGGRLTQAQADDFQTGVVESTAQKMALSIFQTATVCQAATPAP